MFLHSFKIFFLDRNECESKKSSCQQACINTVGSYYCSCFKGYKLLEDFKRCKGEYLPEFYLEPCQTFTKLLSIFVKFSIFGRVRSSHRRCYIKKVFLEILQNSQENTCARASFLIKLKASSCNFIKKETLAQMFFCEFCEISKNTFFEEHLLAAASKGSWLCLVKNYPK